MGVTEGLFETRIERDDDPLRIHITQGHRRDIEQLPKAPLAFPQSLLGLPVSHAIPQRPDTVGQVTGQLDQQLPLIVIEAVRLGRIDVQHADTGRFVQQ